MATTFNVEETLAKLSLPNKIKLLTGRASVLTMPIKDVYTNSMLYQGWWHTEAIPEADVPSIRTSDGMYALYNLLIPRFHCTVFI
jgi:beta-glucosidase